ncbi:hypothetical protein [Jannaschia pohangensis]|uniref:Uncharacterized protein n=1 Tax=Jannaschia pohangensis TaxID=390807 RepID=A0A1I3I6F5_9RHOB|nr:hypothetical protein [Jannaschia pohangensis]SFI43594.1 hypothetical protein SAMN04488095_0837 [Jannaschia pohangensis]
MGGMHDVQVFTYAGQGGAFGEPISVTNPIPSTRTTKGVELWFHPGLGQRPFRDGDLAAMVLTPP